MAQGAPEGTVQASCEALRALARIAPTLREGDIRVTLALIDAFTGQTRGNLSSREIARRARMSRRNVQIALDRMRTRQLISLTEGTATEAAEYSLDFVEVITFQILQRQGGAVTTPPPDPQVALFERQGGAVTTPPSDPQDVDPRGRASIDSISDPIDRLLKANPKTTPEGDLAHARRWLYGYQRKFGCTNHPHSCREHAHQQGAYEPHPPDDKVCAQMCAVFSPIQIENLIHELMAEAPPPQPACGKYSWYVAVGLQRRYGIQPEVLKSRREQFRIERFRGRALTGEQQLLNPGLDANPQFRDELLRDIAAQRRKRAGR